MPSAASEAHTTALMQDLRWLGIDWDAGPGSRGRPRAVPPVAACERLRAATSMLLERAGAVYPCFCSPLELEVSPQGPARRGQAAALCRNVPRALAGAACEEAQLGACAHDCVFAFPPAGASSSWTSCMGRRVFCRMTSAISSFGAPMASAAFFFSNAVDDARMGVTQVLRGEDHLTNTPRQLLILEALRPARAELRPRLADRRRRWRAAVQAAWRHQRPRVPRARVHCPRR